VESWTIGKGRLTIKRGDIAKQDTDAVVNAANRRLAPGGGVAGAIHRAAGERLREHCRKLDGCETGEAVLTPGFELPADHIIHTVGPVYGDHPNPEEALRSCYENSLRRAREASIVSLAFPLLSTGAFGYPVEEAARVALDVLAAWLGRGDPPRDLRLILWGEEDDALVRRMARDRFGTPRADDG